MKTPQIVVVGSSNTDMVVKSQRIPRPGETVTGGQFVMAPGGKGANQAVAAARLGADVTFIAKVGEDLFGRNAVDGYQAEGIDTRHIRFDPAHPTGVALILVDASGENLISVASGANHALTVSDVDQAAASIQAADLLMLQLETPLEANQRAAELASQAGVPVLLDPAPAPEDPLPESLLRRVTCLTPNETEAFRLTGVPVTDRRSAEQAAGKLQAQGARSVIVTLGGKGALVAGARTHFVQPPCVDAVDSTAAGDAFNGGLAVALARGDSLPDAVRFASLAGAASVTRMGAQPSLPTLDEVQRLAARVKIALRRGRS